MRIGIDATSWANARGYGRFLRELLPPLAIRAADDDLVCFLDPRSAGDFHMAGPRIHPVEVALDHAPTEAAVAGGYRSPRDIVRLTRSVAREDLDVFFSPTVYTYFPLPLGLRAVVTIHDTIVERFPALTMPSTRARLFWSLKVRLATAQARLILTVSEYAARDLEQRLGIPRERIRVAVEAPASIFAPSDAPDEVRAVAAGAGVPSGAAWFMYVGGFNPHKRLDVLVRALAMLREELGASTPHLLLVGHLLDGFLGHRPVLVDLIHTLGMDDGVSWPGFIPDESLRHLYAGARALVLPSEAEGFGLPAVEAAACGTPVVATTESPLPQLLTGGGLFVAPGNVEALTAALRVYATDRKTRDDHGRRAHRQAQHLTWPRTAESVYAALREAAA